MTANFPQRLQAALASIRKLSAATPRVGIVLGSGLSELAHSFGGVAIPFSAIEGFPLPTVAGHRGELHLGDTVAVFAGRFHLYEGHDYDTLSLPVALLRALGAKVVILTNAAGGIHHSYQPGDLAAISDHINFQGRNPLTGPHLEGFGPRFPDMSEVYSKRLRVLARHIDPVLHEGVYAAFPGPMYETPAEIRMLRAMGADLVGMSTVPEATLAAALGLEVFGVSVVTNFAAGLSPTRLEHKEVIERGKQAEARLSKLLHGLVSHPEL